MQNSVVLTSGPYVLPVSLHCTSPCPSRSIVLYYHCKFPACYQPFLPLCKLPAPPAPLLYTTTSSSLHATSTTPSPSNVNTTASSLQATSKQYYCKLPAPPPPLLLPRYYCKFPASYQPLCYYTIAKSPSN